MGYTEKSDLRYAIIHELSRVFPQPDNRTPNNSDKNDNIRPEIRLIGFRDPATKFSDKAKSGIKPPFGAVPE